MTHATHPQRRQSKKSFIESSQAQKRCLLPLRHNMSSTSSIAKSSISPMKRARKPQRHRSLISSSQERISSWLRRFDRFRKESAANGTLAIREKLRATAQEIQARWTMAVVSSAELSFRTGAIG